MPPQGVLTVPPPISPDDVVPLTNPDEKFIDREWIESQSSILKCVEIMLDIIGLICSCVWINESKYTGGGWVIFVCLMALLLSNTIFLLYAFSVQPTIEHTLPPKWPWDLCETCYHSGCTLCFLISGIVAAAHPGSLAAAIAAAVFCFLAMAAYGLDAYVCYQRWRAPLPPMQHPAMMSDDAPVTQSAPAQLPAYVPPSSLAHQPQHPVSPPDQPSQAVPAPERAPPMYTQSPAHPGGAQSPAYPGGVQPGVAYPPYQRRVSHDVYPTWHDQQQQQQQHNQPTSVPLHHPEAAPPVPGEQTKATPSDQAEPIPLKAPPADDGESNC